MLKIFISYFSTLCALKNPKIVILTYRNIYIYPVENFGCFLSMSEHMFMGMYAKYTNKPISFFNVFVLGK